MGETSEPVPVQRSGKCPTCGGAVRDDNPYVPFCRERCKMVDLGRWFRGEYAVAGEPAVDLDPEQFAEGLRDLERRARENDDEGGDADSEA